MRRRTPLGPRRLREEDSPALTSRVEELAAAFASDEEFERGLERLLDGIEASLAKP